MPAIKQFILIHLIVAHHTLPYAILGFRFAQVDALHIFTFRFSSGS
jgi:hypothetical protein